METVLMQAIAAVQELHKEKSDQNLWEQSQALHEAIMLLSNYVVEDGRQIREAYNEGAKSGVQNGATYYLKTFSKAKEVKQK